MEITVSNNQLISQLIIYYTCKIFFEGVLTRLKYPYPRDVEEPNMYETVRIHAEIGRTFSVQESPNFSVRNEYVEGTKAVHFTGL